MTGTSESIKDKTFTIDSDIQYSSATTKPINFSKNSWIKSDKVQSVSTNRVEGQIKLRVASREILEPNYSDSTK